MKEENIHKIIDQYFEAGLSRPEEEELFRSLLEFKGEDRKVKEALAVMLMSRNPDMLTKERKPTVLRNTMESWHPTLRPLKWAAAAAIIAITCATALLYHSHINPGDETEGMMAYVRGEKVSDHSEIMKIVDDQLNDIYLSTESFSQTVVSDLYDISNAFNEEDI